MKKHLIPVASALLLALVITLGLRAEEKTKEKMKPAEKPAKEMYYTAECSDPCEFSVRSSDKNEVAALVKDHARAYHHQEMAEKDVDGLIKAHTVRKQKEKEAAAVRP